MFDFIDFIFIIFISFGHVVGMWDLNSLTRDQTCTPCGEAWSPIHWTARKVPMFDFSKFNLNWKQISWKKTSNCVMGPQAKQASWKKWPLSKLFKCKKEYGMGMGIREFLSPPCWVIFTKLLYFFENQFLSIPKKKKKKKKKKKVKKIELSPS